MPHYASRNAKLRPKIPLKLYLPKILESRMWKHTEFVERFHDVPYKAAMIYDIYKITRELNASQPRQVSCYANTLRCFMKSTSWLRYAAKGNSMLWCSSRSVSLPNEKAVKLNVRKTSRCLRLKTDTVSQPSLNAWVIFRRYSYSKTR